VGGDRVAAGLHMRAFGEMIAHGETRAGVRRATWA
jgi:hypothetical protein